MPSSTLPKHLLEVFASRYAGVATGDDLVHWAVSALDLGLNTRSLRMLAGLTTPISQDEADPLFRSSLRELGIEAPTLENLWRPYLTWICTAIEEGRVTPDEGADRIHSRVVSPLEHPKELEGWCRLWEGFHPGDSFTPAEGKERDRLIREAARDEVVRAGRA